MAVEIELNAKLKTEARRGRQRWFGLAFLVLAAFFSRFDEAGASGTPNACVKRLASGENRFRVRIPLAALMKTTQAMKQIKNRLSQDRYALIVDYSRRSTERRSFLIDFKSCEVVLSDYVIHGGSVYKPVEQHFGDPNQDGRLDHCVHGNGSRKNMTRPGLYLTKGCHQTMKSGWPSISEGCQGVKLDGLQRSNNDALQSGVVLHEHDEIPDNNSIKPAGQGCPAYPPGRLKAMLSYGLSRGALVLVHAPQCDEASKKSSSDRPSNQPRPSTRARIAR